MPLELWILAFLVLFIIAIWSIRGLIKALEILGKAAEKAAAKDKEEWGEYGRDWEYNGDYFLRNLFK